MVLLRLLGPVGVAGAPLPATKPRSLLAALALHVGQVVSTGTLIDAVWEQDPPASHAKLLQVYVSQLRKVLPAEVRLVTRSPGYVLELDREQIDVCLFADLARSGRSALMSGRPQAARALLSDAVALWQGAPLADVGPAPLFDEETDRLHELHGDVLEDLCAARLALGEAAEVLSEVRALAERYPLREGVQASLVLALYQCGRQAEALAAYDALRVRLRDELGLAPGTALQELQVRVLRQDTSLDERAAAAAHALPVPLNATVGRDAELGSLEALLRDPAQRLITLTGQGGSGKTRLALVAAGRAQSAFEDGAVFVALESVREPGQVMAELATALGVRVVGEDPASAMTRELAHRRSLVVLDNVEQAVAVGPALAALLTELPGMTVLVTSRVLLGVTGEHAFPVPPLVCPSGRSLADIESNPAVALFCQRAQSALPSFALNDHNAADLAELCRRLDGLPLALELSAAQSRLLSPGQLLSRLRSRLDAPGPGQSDRPLRHQSLRSVLDGSYELLSEPARELLATLSVFVGGFDVQAAEQVCGAGLASLGELIDHSLVHVRAGASMRFLMLETVREFAAEHRHGGAIGREHARYFLELAEEADAELDGPHQPERLAQLDREHDNLRTALSTFREAQEVEQELRLAVALARFWYVRGYLTESRDRLAGALARASALPASLRANALRKVSANAVLRGHYPEALGFAEQALELYDELGDRLGRARSLSNMGAMAHGSGDHARARRWLDEAVVLASELGAERVQALALNNLGDLCLTLRDFAQASRLFEQSLALLQTQGDTANVARSLLNLALSALGSGATEEARQHVVRSLELCVDLGDAEDIAWCLLTSAALRGTTDASTAAVLLGAAESLLRDIGAVLKPYERSLHAQTVEVLTTALGATTFAQVRAQGQGLDVASAVALTRSWGQ